MAPRSATGLQDRNVKTRWLGAVGWSFAISSHCQACYTNTAVRGSANFFWNGGWPKRAQQQGTYLYLLRLSLMAISVSAASATFSPISVANRLEASNDSIRGTSSASTQVILDVRTGPG